MNSDHQQSSKYFARFVNPGVAERLEAFDYHRPFVRALGTRLWDADGREYLDFYSGGGVHNIGHNHPRLAAALQESLCAQPASLLGVDAPAHQAALAEKLNTLTHPELSRAIFAGSGAEAVEMAIKTARAATGRSALLACEGGCHGTTTGALALTGRSALREPFGKLIKKVEWVSFGDLAALKEAVLNLKPAAFFVEPIQAEGGVVIPADDYLAKATAFCHKHGCLMVADEIQTGLGRTGSLFAGPFMGRPANDTRSGRKKESAAGETGWVPDVLLLGGALGGGVVPMAVALVRACVWSRCFEGPERCDLNASSLAGGHLACTAASTTLDILEGEGLAARAARTGAMLVARLRERIARYPIVREVRGRGLLIGIEFEPAGSILMQAAAPWTREGLFVRVLCALLLRDHAIVAQPCSLKQNVLRVEPPLNVSDEEIDRFVGALEHTLAACPSHGAALKASFRKRVLGRAL